MHKSSQRTRARWAKIRPISRADSCSGFQATNTLMRASSGTRMLRDLSLSSMRSLCSRAWSRCSRSRAQRGSSSSWTRSNASCAGRRTSGLTHVLLVVAGTTSFYEDRKGIRELEPLRQRIETSFDEAYPDLEAVQVRLPPFDRSRLIEVGRRIRAVYVDYIGDQSIGERIDDEIIGLLADDVIGAFGGDIAVAPRQFFRRLISTLGKAKTYPEYDPRADRVDRAELVREVQLSDPEREALGEARIAMPLDL
jgi:hypothetical protein